MLRLIESLLANSVLASPSPPTLQAHPEVPERQHRGRHEPGAVCGPRLLCRALRHRGHQRCVQRLGQAGGSGQGRSTVVHAAWRVATSMLACQSQLHHVLLAAHPLLRALPPVSTPAGYALFGSHTEVGIRPAFVSPPGWPCLQAVLWCQPEP